MNQETKHGFNNLQQIRDRIDDKNLPADAQSILHQAFREMETLHTSLTKQIETLNQELQQIRQSKNKFVSVVTHELRLPMTSIKGYTDLLRQGVIGPLNDQQLNFLNVIRNNVERMSGLISDLSDMSHIETGRLKLNSVNFSVVDQIEEVLRTWEPKCIEKKQDLEIDIPANIGMIRSDPNRFSQIVGNLISNAHSYTPPGGKIILRAHQEGEKLHFEVSDNGIGISQEDQAKLFTPFFRSENEAVREHPGWGLALHVSMLLVKTLGGDMGVQSVLNQGSTFWFTIPINKVT